MTGPEAVARLFGVGLLWMGVHCAGMCGPLLLGLDVSGSRGGSSVVGGAWRTALYQLGKACSYAVLGAVAGLVGAGLEEVSARAGAVLAIGFGVFALLHTSGALRAGVGIVGGGSLFKVGAPVQVGAPPTTTERLLSRLRPLLVSRHPLRPFFLGMALAFLPCMISLWALGLAALTSSPAWGAVVMLSLALSTTPLLIATSLLARGALLLPVRLSVRLRGRLQRASALVAGSWLVLIGLAALDVIDHVHVPFSLAGRGFVLMLF